MGDERDGRGGGSVAVAVTGAAGLIGHATRLALSGAGCRVQGHAGPPHLRPADDDQPGAGALDPGFVWGELADDAVLAEAFDGAGTVIHLAGPASVAASFADPAGAVAAHAAGTASVVRAAARSGTVRRVVVASSAEVYGTPQTDRVAEDHPLDPLTPYAAGKLGAEAAARSLAYALGLELVLLRPFAVYGPRSPAWSLVGSTVRRALSGDDVTMTSLDRVRDLTHVDDVAALFMTAALAPLPRQVLTLNVCTGIGTSVADLVRSALRAAGSTAQMHEAAAGPDPTRAEVLAGRRPPSSDPFRLVGDPTLAATTLGWVARTHLDAGVAAMVAEVRRQQT